MNFIYWESLKNKENKNIRKKWNDPFKKNESIVEVSLLLDVNGRLPWSIA